MRLLLAWASVASVVLWLPVGIGTAYAWLAREDLKHAPQTVQTLAATWLYLGGAYPAISTLAITLAWSYHRRNKDHIAKYFIAMPGACVAVIFTLAFLTISLGRRYVQ